MGVEEFPYIAKSIQNVRDVDPVQTGDLYEEIRKADAVGLHGEGRSYSALRIWGSELAKSMPEYDVCTPNDPGFPGDNPEQFVPCFQDKYDKVAWIVNSGSGESESPATYAGALADYLDKNDVENFSINAITSHPDSRLGKLAKENGTLVELEGRRPEDGGFGYLEEGTMGDIFENASLLLGQSLVESLYYEDDFYDILDEKVRRISKDLEKIDDDAIEEMLSEIPEKHDVYFDGRGSAREVARMAAIRTDHVKALPAVGGRAVLRGGVERKNSKGDLLIAISSSGETAPLLKSCEGFKSSGGEVMSILGNSSSELQEISDYSVELEGEKPNHEPDDFYTRATFLYSPVPNMVLEDLNSKGFNIPEGLMRDRIHA